MMCRPKVLWGALAMWVLSGAGMAQAASGIGDFWSSSGSGPSAIVPEPASLVLMGLGGLLCLSRKRRSDRE